MIRIGVIGCGYWGPNLIRNFWEIPQAQVASVCDLMPERLKEIQRRYPGIKVTQNHRDLLGDADLDALVIATPVGTHFPLALQALRAGKHVLVEKPLASTVSQAHQLIAEAERRRRILMVGHTFVYHDAVRQIKKLVVSGQLGDIHYYDSVRVNLGIFQHDVNVLWDLAVHDLSIMDYVLPEKPTAVLATGVSHISGKPENIAYLTCFFESSLIAHIHVNWLAPVKVRSTLICGDRKMIVYDDLEPSEKIKVYDRGITIENAPEGRYEMLVGYRVGDMWAPKLEMVEALRTEVLHFVRCIEKGERPISDGEAGLRVVQILEAASKSMKHRGRLVKLNKKAVSRNESQPLVRGGR